MTMTLDRRDGVLAEPVFGRRDPDARGYFGAYGGRFVPETLVEPVAALERAYFAARADRTFVDEFVSVLRQFVGRPTPLYEAARLSEDVGCRVFLKREDLAHTGAHKINNAHRPGAAGEAHGQDAHRRRDRRRPARRRLGHRVRAARPRVRGLHGDRGHGAAGAERLAHAAARRRPWSASTPAAAPSRTRSARRCATGSAGRTTPRICSARPSGRIRIR